MGAEPCSLSQSVPGRKRNSTELRVRGSCLCSHRVPSDPEGTDRPEATSPEGSQPLGGWQDRACSLPPSSPSLPCHLAESTPHALTGMGLRAEEELSTPLTLKGQRHCLAAVAFTRAASWPSAHTLVFRWSVAGLGSGCVCKVPRIAQSYICIIFIALVG